MGGEGRQGNRADQEETRDRHHLARIPDLHQRQHDPAGAEHHQDRTEIVDAVPSRRLMFMQEPAEHHKRRGADRQIDPKHERPTDVLDEKSAEYRADDCSNTPHPRDIALHPGALSGTVDVADDRRGNRLNGARACPLQPAEQDQRYHAPRQSAQCRAEQEKARPGKEHAFAPVEIGEPPVDRNRHRLSQEVGGKGPAEQVKPAELGNDRRHCGSDDRQVDRRHEDRHHHGGQHHPARRLVYCRRLLREPLCGGLIEQGIPMQKPRCNWSGACATSGHPAHQGCTSFQPIGGATLTQVANPSQLLRGLPSNGSRCFRCYLQEIISDEALLRRRNPRFSATWRTKKQRITADPGRHSKHCIAKIAYFGKSVNRNEAPVVRVPARGACLSRNSL